MHFFKYKKAGPEILQRSKSGTEEDIVANGKTRKVKNVELLYTQKTYIHQ